MRHLRTIVLSCRIGDLPSGEGLVASPCVVAGEPAFVAERRSQHQAHLSTGPLLMPLIPRLDLGSLDRQPLEPLTKGLPFDAPELTVGAVGQQGWNVLKGDMPLPLAVIRQDVVRANSAWMSA